MVYAGIDYHKNYSVVHLLDEEGATLRQGRVDGNRPAGFAALLGGFEPGQVHCVFEATMNWGKLYDVLVEIEAVAQVTMAHPFKTRIIAEAQVKTDKLDARWLARLLRAGLIAEAHASSASARRRKELLRQRCYFVRQRTALRNRTHLLIGTQREPALPAVSDLFGKKGMAALRKLEFDQPHRDFMFSQDLRMLEELNERIREGERAVAAEFAQDEDYRLLLSLPGFGPTLAALAACEIDGVTRFRSAKKLLGYAGLAPTTSSSGGKIRQGRLMRSCNRWLKWAFIEAAWVAIGCSPYFGGIYRAARARGKGANISITIVAGRMAQIAFQMLSQRREYQPVFTPESKNTHPGCPRCTLVDGCVT